MHISAFNVALVIYIDARLDLLSLLLSLFTYLLMWEAVLQLLPSGLSQGKVVPSCSVGCLLVIITIQHTVQHSLRLNHFTVSLHSPNDRHLPTVRGLSVGFEKWWKYPTVRWTHNPLHLRQSQPMFKPTNHKKSDASQLEAISFIPQIVVMPTG